MSTFNEHFEGYLVRGVDYIQNEVPEVKRVLSLEEIEELRLADVKDELLDSSLLVLMYQAKAPKLFPYVRKSLLERSAVKRHNILSTRISDNSYGTRIGFWGNTLQLFIDFYDGEIPESEKRGLPLSLS